MSGRGRRIGIGAIGIAVSILALAVLAAAIDVRSTLDALSATEPAWLAATLLMVPGQVILRALRWRLLLPRRPDGQRPATRRVGHVILVGYFANLVLPARLGEPVRAYLLARRERLRLPRVLGSVLLERVLDLVTLAPLAFVAAVVVGAPPWLVSGTALAGLIGAVLLVGLAASGIPRAGRLVGRLLGTRLPRLSAPIGMVVSFGEGAGGGGRRAVAASATLSALTWAFVAGTFWLVGRALGLELDPAAAMLIAAVTTLGSAIPSAPANIGTFEVAAVVAAGALGVAGGPALALALLAHAATTIPYALAGGAAVTWMSVPLSSLAGEAMAEVQSATGRP